MTMQSIHYPITRYAQNIQLSEHFNEQEFACTCHGKYCNGIPENGIHPLLPILLESIRENIGNTPIAIHGGYRCPKRNKAVGGKPNSFHKKGMAADISAINLGIKELHRATEEALAKLRKLNPLFIDVGGGIGFYSTQGFIHVDVRKQAARWSG